MNFKTAAGLAGDWLVPGTHIQGGRVKLGSFRLVDRYPLLHKPEMLSFWSEWARDQLPVFHSKKTVKKVTAIRAGHTLEMRNHVLFEKQNALRWDIKQAIGRKSLKGLMHIHQIRQGPVQGCCIALSMKVAEMSHIDGHSIDGLPSMSQRGLQGMANSYHCLPLLVAARGPQLI
ncbi:uncharacterized protein LOC131307225 [Rhododendron vialii]|uniref:uncharacterized protein LOC131307225 n=1 Tax=Rhododendron vialii TaxID=182163 RepID=UPI00265D61CF|nr:uncharacterized protein LOC131307225 [Rhododendron vialii]